MRQDLVGAGGGEAFQIGKTLHEPVEVRYDGFHLRLLQHDLRYPDPVGRARVLPRQVLAAVFIPPREQLL